MPGASVDNAISHQTKLTLGVVIVLVGGGTAFLYRDIDKQREQMVLQAEQRERILAIETSVSQIQQSLEAGLSDRWTIAAEAESALRLKLANPSLQVPDPRQPGQYITSGGTP